MSDVLATGDTPAAASSRYVAAVDVGTTSIRCHIYSERGEIIADSSDSIVLSYPEPSAVELDPSQLWTKFVSVVKNAMSSK